jgi:hypothetical protein
MNKWPVVILNRLARSRPFEFLSEGVLLLFIFLFLFRGLLNTGMLAYSDLRAHTYWNSIDLYFSSWQPFGLGVFEYRAPVDFVQSVLGGVGGPVAAQKLMFLGLLPIGSILMYWAMRQIGLGRP